MLRLPLIALLGATGHIGKALVHQYAQGGWSKRRFVLYARRPEETARFLESLRFPHPAQVRPANAFPGRNRFDVILNCVGIGEPAKLKQDPAAVFGVTESYDNRVLDYLRRIPQALYINFSSGAVYGKEFSAAAVRSKALSVKVNELGPTDAYGIAKLNAEVKHRVFSAARIVDLRVFAFFSRFINLDSGYFITDLIKAARDGTEFVTDNRDMVRDFAHPCDLAHLIELLSRVGKINAAVDVYGLKPVSKFELLEHFARVYGLRYKVRASAHFDSATGSKSVYCSRYKLAQQLVGYCPRYTSLETVSGEAAFILTAPAKKQ